MPSLYYSLSPIFFLKFLSKMLVSCEDFSLHVQLIGNKRDSTITLNSHMRKKGNVLGKKGEGNSLGTC